MGRNEVWLITAGDALFAAFPEWYSTMFSGFYLPLLLIMVSLILRGVGLEWRGKVDTQIWRDRCDIGIAIGSWVPTLLWGIAFANIARGVPIDGNRQIDSGIGALFFLLNPVVLIGGVFSMRAGRDGVAFAATCFAENSSSRRGVCYGGRVGHAAKRSGARRAVGLADHAGIRDAAGARAVCGDHLGACPGHLPLGLSLPRPTGLAQHRPARTSPVAGSHSTPRSPAVA